MSNIVRTVKVNPVTGAAARAIGRVLSAKVESFVFVASTGRSGTNSLERVFGAAPDCVALHEPHPIMHDAILNQYNEGNDALLDANFMQRKLPYIFWAARGKRWYVETNHMFIRTFAYAAARELSPKIKVIYLVRNPEEMAASNAHRQLATFGASATRSYRYGLRPTAHRNLIRPWDDAEFSAKYRNIFFEYLWECYEVAARLRDFHRRYPDVPVYRLETEHLNDVRVVSDLMAWVGIELEGELGSVIGIRANASHHVPNPLPEGVTRELVDCFNAVCRAALEKFPPVRVSKSLPEGVEVNYAFL